MRYISMLVAFCILQAMGADELTLALSTPANKPVTATVPYVNTNRGTIPTGPTVVETSIWKIRHSWTGNTRTAGSTQIVRLQQPSGIELGRWFFPFVENPTPVSNAIQDAYTVFKNKQDVDGIPPFTNTLRVDTVQAAQHGTVAFDQAFNPTGANEFSGPRFAYTPAPGYVGTDELVLMYRDGFDADQVAVRVSINVVNTPPQATATASPSTLASGGSCALTANASDENGDALTYQWNFGDGFTGSGATVEHTYSASGIYVAIVSVSDGISSTQASVTVVVAGGDRLPVARFLTSDVAAFVGLPFTFDATPSTDPQNALVGYQWNFGDNSPIGSERVISKVYDTAGVYPVTLTVTDAEGLRQSVTRELEVLPADLAATFDSEVQVSTVVQPTRQGRDTLNVFARVNIGDVQLNDGADVALEIQGSRFSAKLNKRLKAVGWTVKQNLRRQAFGTVEISIRLRAITLGSVLTSIGAADGAAIDVPFRFEVGGKVIEVPVETNFDGTALRLKGTGEL